MIKIFFSYAHEDEKLMNEVRRQLIVYERQGYIFKWYDREILSGDEWKKEIDNRLEEAQIILLFMSPRFIESKYCYDIEGERALERHRSNQAVVIPIILKPCAWDESPFGQLQALPKDGKPVTNWSNIDNATLNIARGIKLVVDNLSNNNKDDNIFNKKIMNHKPVRLNIYSKLKKSTIVYSLLAIVFFLFILLTFLWPYFPHSYRQTICVWNENGNNRLDGVEVIYKENNQLLGMTTKETGCLPFKMTTNQATIPVLLKKDGYSAREVEIPTGDSSQDVYLIKE